MATAAAPIDRKLNAARKRRALANLDKALKARGVKVPAKRPATPSPRTEARRARARAEGRTAQRTYAELRSAIVQLGGIRPNRDYKSSVIPRELRAKAGRPGLPMDEMAQILASRGFHYDGDAELFTDIERRKESAATGRQAARTARGQKNPSTICTTNKRDRLGRFVSSKR